MRQAISSPAKLKLPPARYLRPSHLVGYLFVAGVRRDHSPFVVDVDLQILSTGDREPMLNGHQMWKFGSRSVDVNASVGASCSESIGNVERTWLRSSQISQTSRRSASDNGAHDAVVDRQDINAAERCQQTA